jgi:hypothetical protein
LDIIFSNIVVSRPLDGSFGKWYEEWSEGEVELKREEMEATVWEAKEKEKSGPSTSDQNMLCQWPLTSLVIMLGQFYC